MQVQIKHQGGCEVGDLDLPECPSPIPLDTQSCLPTTVELQCMQGTQHQGVPFKNSSIHFMDAGRRLSSNSCAFTFVPMSCDEHSMLSQLPSPRASDRAMLPTHYSPDYSVISVDCLMIQTQNPPKLLFFKWVYFCVCRCAP